MTNPAKPAAKSRGRSAPTQHSGRRQVVLASAEVELLQVQVIGTDGEEKAVLVYRCGPDMFWGKSMDDVFNLERRKIAPDWLRKGLDSLPDDRRFRADGGPVAIVADEADDAPAPASHAIAQG